MKTVGWDMYLLRESAQREIPLDKSNFLYYTKVLGAQSGLIACALTGIAIIVGLAFGISVAGVAGFFAMLIVEAIILSVGFPITLIVSTGIGMLLGFILDILRSYIK